ncbi:SNF2 family N-terminal domain-containing protein [Pisolithus orientalis]|uniref:SNF2 family N-terminal domain-containing protein n=1 Tax=Pisolithus orientalis TaxID=936130 RepID=UPI0022257F39|nr:SNF2 family N-terminal domain-containing protein [Pisolithus orientalis]KAI6032893.1 SNF2 family N-terminal domain-containing protein [Pisolithus orientalis]
MPGHVIDYSKSSLSVCKGPSPCTGSSIAVGSLRYGTLVPSEFGEIVIWRHWGCVTPDILRILATVDLNSVTGFNTLRPEDQGKVRRAIAGRRVDPVDIPTSAKAIAAPMSQPLQPLMPLLTAPEPTSANQRQRKRKQLSESSEPSVPSVSGVSTSSRPRTNDEDEEVLLIEPEPIDELYCIFKTRVVALTLLPCRRGVQVWWEPANRNAIKVVNIGGMQVGHIPKEIAARAAPLLDKGLVNLEGTMLSGNLGAFSYSLELELRIYGMSDKRDILEPQLAWATRQWGWGGPGGQVPGALSAPSYAGAATSAAQIHQSQPVSRRRRATSVALSQSQDEATKKQQQALAKAKELAQVLGTLEKVDDDSRRTSLLDTLCTADDILNLPVHPNPPGVASGDLVVDLLKHQSQALQWCIEREHPTLPTTESDRPVQFWQYRKAGNKTPQEITTPPVLGRGALVADSMGLGKTLTMLSLILATKKDVPSDHSQATLIVVPLSVMSNWEQQVEEHCTRGALNTYVYYGASRSMAADGLTKYDVVITTYQTVVVEAEPSVFTDSRLGGHRVILDEGHNIRNAKTKMARAVCRLTAQRRWVLSGTPIINSPRDLGSILTFLQICRPLDDEDFFKRLLLRPLKQGDPAGVELLRALMTQVCIRRTKEMRDSQGKPLVSLPPVDVTLIPVTLHEGARLDQSSRRDEHHCKHILESPHIASLALQVTSNVLSMLTRLRQIALHPGLIPVNYLEQLQATDELPTQPSVGHITPELKERLQAQLSKLIEDSEECPICFSVLTDPRITPCAHAFCLRCISEVIARDPKCPMDRRRINAGELIESPPPVEFTQLPARHDDQGCNELRMGSSAKIDQLVDLLKLLPSDEKSLVFSQFTSFLDKIGETLSEHGIPYVRFDGQLSARRRQEILERFSIPLETESCIDISTGVTDTDVYDLTDDGTTEDDDLHQGISSLVEKSKEKASESIILSNANSKSLLNGSMLQGKNPKVMLISLKAGALGLNLTVANNVFLYIQEGIESQAIDRCNRIGQKRPVHVYQLIAENTVESKVIEIQERKKKLIQHAFSGAKQTETQRERREARLQDLIQLLGIQQRG